MDILTAIMWMCPAAKWHLEGGTDYEHLVWDDVFFPKPTESELQSAYRYAVLSQESGRDYRILRKTHYPTAEEQLAMIYDLGIDGWKARIDSVKSNIPKTE